MPKISKIQAKRQHLNKIIKDLKTSTINTRFVGLSQNRPAESGEDKEGQKKKKKKKGLTEKDLDFDEQVDDDGEEDQINFEEANESADENLAEDGKKIRQFQESEEAKNPAERITGANLEINQEEEEDVSEDKDKEKGQGQTKGKKSGLVQIDMNLLNGGN